MVGLDDWHDLARVAIFFTCFLCLFVLILRFWQEGQNWNTKTKDYWFALLMWTLSGCIFSIQGVALDRPFTPGFVFLVAAALVTSKGLFRKGRWGGDS